MSRFLSAYNTTACAGQVTKPVEDALLTAFIKGDISLDADSGTLLVTGLYSTVNIPAFNHPITLDIEGVQKTFVDVRAAVKLEPHTTNYRVVDRKEYDFIVQRGHLHGLWNGEMPSLLRDISKLPLAVYANIVSDLVTRRLALDPRDAQILTILAAAFYLNLFNEPGNEKKNDAFHMSGIIANSLKMKQATVLETLEGNTVINDLADFCRVAQEVTASVRLRDLNAYTLIQIVSGAWYGNNGRELMGVALEHPPTWLSLLYRAKKDAGMLKSGLGTFLDRGIFRSLSEHFPESLDQLAKRPI